jgi:glycosyltransferase involved in cell wall biosynthesis
MSRVSVVIPIYNAGKKLTKCIESILKQTFTDFELILVNDGSTDDSLEICRKYSKIDNRIKVINKENEGSIKTRKRGVDASKSEYIMFVDADDWVDNNIIETLYNEVQENNVEIAVCNMYRVIGNVKRNVDCSYLNTNKIYIGNEIKTELIKSYIWGHSFPSSLCAKLYKKELLQIEGKYLNRIRFLGDDLFYNLEILLNTRSVKVIDKPLYYYRRGGFTNSFMPHLFDDMVNCYEIQKEVINEYFYTTKESETNGISLMLLNTFRTCLYNLFNGNLKTEEIQEKILDYSSNTSVIECLSNKMAREYFSKSFLQAIENKDVGTLYQLGKRLYFKSIPRKVLIKTLSKLGLF